jgi:hypothetical protein
MWVLWLALVGADAATRCTATLSAGDRAVEVAGYGHDEPEARAQAARWATRLAAYSDGEAMVQMLFDQPGIAADLPSWQPSAGAPGTSVTPGSCAVLATPSKKGAAVTLDGVTVTRFDPVIAVQAVRRQHCLSRAADALAEGMRNLATQPAEQRIATGAAQLSRGGALLEACLSATPTLAAAKVRPSKAGVYRCVEPGPLAVDGVADTLEVARELALQDYADARIVSGVGLAYQGRAYASDDTRATLVASALDRLQAPVGHSDGHEQALLACSVAPKGTEPGVAYQADLQQARDCWDEVPAFLTAPPAPRDRFATCHTSQDEGVAMVLSALAHVSPENFDTIGATGVGVVLTCRASCRTSLRSTLEGAVPLQPRTADELRALAQTADLDTRLALFGVVNDDRLRWLYLTEKAGEESRPIPYAELPTRMVDGRAYFEIP